LGCSLVLLYNRAKITNLHINIKDAVFKIANMVYGLTAELSIFTGNASYLWYYRSPWNKFLMTPSTELPRCNLEEKK
jgi:hypothetical protein